MDTFANSEYPEENNPAPEASFDAPQGRTKLLRNHEMKFLRSTRANPSPAPITPPVRAAGSLPTPIPPI